MNVTVLLSITIVASFQIWREVRAMLFCLAVSRLPSTWNLCSMFFASAWCFPQNSSEEGI